MLEETCCGYHDYKVKAHQCVCLLSVQESGGRAIARQRPLNTLGPFLLRLRGGQGSLLASNLCFVRSLGTWLPIWIALVSTIATDMATLDRTAELTDAFLQFSKDGKPLNADELVPVGKRIRGPQWDPAKRHQLLAKIDGDCDGLVGSQDFAIFMLGKLATVSDEDFLSALRRLKRPPRPLPVSEQVVEWFNARACDAAAGDRPTLAGAGIVFIFLGWIFGCTFYAVALVAMSAASKAGWDHLTYEPPPPPPKGPRGSHKAARQKSKGKKAAKGKKPTGRPPVADAPKNANTAQPVEDPSAAAAEEEEEEDELFWEYEEGEEESDEESDEEDEDDYDLSLLLGHGSAINKKSNRTGSSGIRSSVRAPTCRQNLS